ncbi:MAG: hypothetical protein RL391_1410 [Actinomycetota bacterium]|jgi:protein MpaA
MSVISVVLLVVAACSGAPEERVAEPTLVPSTSPSTTSTGPSTTAAEPWTLVTEYSSIGTSVEGRPIRVAHRIDLPGSRLAIDDPNRIVILVVGVIHGDEQAGLEVIRELHDLPRSRFADDATLANVDLWMIPTINPDGVAAKRRTNANLVDLNRNFPYNWGPIEEPGHWQYAGPGPASEPETRAFTAFVEELRPDLTVWYHQDAFSIAPSDGPDGPVRAEYARLTGLPLEGVPGGIYTGVAATWQRRTFVDDTAFIVELGPSLAPDEAQIHASAILAVVPLLP